MSVALAAIETPSWVYGLDTLSLLDVNDAAVRAYGWSRDELLAMTLLDIRPPEDAEPFRANAARLRDHPGGVTAPWRHRRKDGSVVEVSVAYVSVRHAGQAARLAIITPARPVRDALSPRERQVLCLVARGFTSAQIAEQLALSPKSIETYRARFARKLRLHTRADLVGYALDHHLLAG